jgi:hypothetical protein
MRPTKAPTHAALQPSRVAARRVAKPVTTKALAATGPVSVASVRPASEAFAKLAAPLAEKKGQRIVVYGITGKGKTTGVTQFLAYIAGRQLIDLIIIHDVKFRERQQYEGAVIHEARDIYTVEHAPTAFPATVVLRKRNLDHMPSVEGAARVTLESADQGIRTMLVVDEFARALEEEIIIDGKTVPFRKGSANRIACEGFGLGASLIAIKQLPQFMPSEVRAQSELVLFGLAGDGLTHLVDERVAKPEMAEKLGKLERGQFMIKPAEGAPDGIVYEVPPP